jgi:outer membrane protein assembly factor BamA
MSYHSVQRYAHSISSERGRRLGVGLRIDHPSLGSDFKGTQFSYSWTEYIDLPWVDEHVIALRLAGGITTGELSRSGVYFLGGFPEQDILRSIFESTRVGGVFLRGYPLGVVYGNQYHLFNFEYRMPLFNIERGLSSLPLYFTHVHLSTFVDVGNAFFGHLKPSELKVGVGAEIMVEAVIGYFLPSTFKFSYARGLMDQGGNEFHFLIGNSF